MLLTYVGVLLALAAILMLVADGFENRGDGEDARTAPLPKRVAALLAPYRRGRLA